MMGWKTENSGSTDPEPHDVKAEHHVSAPVPMLDCNTAQQRPEVETRSVSRGTMETAAEAIRAKLTEAERTLEHLRSERDGYARHLVHVQSMVDKVQDEVFMLRVHMNELAQ